jgi:hypothetical protein
MGARTQPKGLGARLGSLIRLYVQRAMDGWHIGRGGKQTERMAFRRVQRSNARGVAIGVSGC